MSIGFNSFNYSYNLIVLYICIYQNATPNFKIICSGTYQSLRQLSAPESEPSHQREKALFPGGVSHPSTAKNAQLIQHASALNTPNTLNAQNTSPFFKGSM